MADLALRPLSLGELLDRAFAIFRRRFGALLLPLVIGFAVPIALMLGSLQDLMALAQMGETGAPAEQIARAMTFVSRFLLVGLVAFVGMIFARGAIVHIASEAMVGRDAPIGEGLRVSLSRTLAMTGLSIVEAAILFLAMMVCYMPIILLVGGAGSGGVASAVGGLAAFVLLVVVMLWLVAAFFVTVPVLVREPDAGVFKALERSWNLTRDRRLSILGLMAIVMVLSLLLFIALSVVAAMFGSAAAGETQTMGPALMISFGVNILVNLIVTAYYYVLQPVAYYDLRVRKEGLDLELMAAAAPVR